MFAVLTAIFACVIAAAGLVGLVLLTSRLRALALGWDSRLGRHAIELQELRKIVNERTPTALRAEVDDLRAALDVIRASHRREFGSLWGRLGGKPNGKVIDNDTGLALEGSDELEALLALQRAKPVQP